MNARQGAYPDISDLLRQKAAGRKEIAARSFGEKIAMVERMRERLEPLKQMREVEASKRGERR